MESHDLTLERPGVNHCYIGDVKCKYELAGANQILTFRGPIVFARSWTGANTSNISFTPRNIFRPRHSFFFNIQSLVHLPTSKQPSSIQTNHDR